MRLNTSLARPYTAALLVAFWLASPSAAQTANTRPSTNVVHTAKVRIDNFGRVNPNYYRGAQPNGRDYADLSAVGIKTLINLTSDDAANEKTMAENAGMKHFQIPMTTHVPPTPEKLAEFFSIVNNPANQPVYVHCAGGRHRTGVMTAVYRMTHDAWTAHQAFTEMKEYKFGADFLHPEFKKFIYGYRADTAHTAPAQAEVAAAKTGG